MYQQELETAFIAGYETGLNKVASKLSVNNVLEQIGSVGGSSKRKYSLAGGLAGLWLGGGPVSAGIGYFSGKALARRRNISRGKNRLAALAALGGGALAYKHLSKDKDK